MQKPRARLRTCNEIGEGEINRLRKNLYRPGVKAPLFDRKGRVLLGRLPDGCPNRFNLPGGGVDGGEVLAVSLQRKFDEEISGPAISLNEISRATIVAEGKLPFPGDEFQGKHEYIVAVPVANISAYKPKPDSKLVCYPPHAVPCDIVQTYLVGVPGKTERVRARGQNNYWVYSHTVKEYVAAGVAVERERILTRSEYDNYMIRRDYRRVDIHKTRHCFVYDGHYCELDVFHTGRRVGEVHLEIEVARSDMQKKIDLPSFLQIGREVTHEKGYSNFDMSAPMAVA